MTSAQPRNWSDLTTRVVSGIVMAAAALISVWAGGLLCLLFWGAAGVAVFAEWLAMMTGRQALSPALVAGTLAVAVAAIVASMAWPWVAVLVLVAGAIAVAILTRGTTGGDWAVYGVPYAGLAALPVILLRLDPHFGLIAIFYLFAVVWGSDVFAYLIGRSVGGPKLWPRVSPKKTWSGFLGGTLSGAILATLVAWAGGVPSLAMPFLLGFVLAVISQGGDLFESSLKRRQGVKDSSNLIPGHGGVMDRLDGFIAAGAVALLVALLRAPEAAGSGLLVW